MWQLTGIPCVHAIAALNKKRSVLSYVSKWYTKEYFLKAYNHGLSPIPGPVEWPRKEYEVMEPPLKRAMPGRPKKKRRRGIDEVEGSRQHGLRVGEKQRCRRCLGYGHNRRNCTNVPFEKTPNKNRGGRPIHGRFVGRKRKKRGVTGVESVQGLGNEPEHGSHTVVEQGEGSSRNCGRGRPRGRGRGGARGRGRSVVGEQLGRVVGDGGEQLGRVVGGGNEQLGRGVGDAFTTAANQPRRSERPGIALRGGRGLSWLQRRCCTVL